MAVTVAGCGRSEVELPNRAVVSGKITYDGKPLPGGNIAFTLKDDPVYVVDTLIQPDGSYSSNRIPIGTCIVTIDTEILKLGNPDAYTQIPRKYYSLDKSGLSADIKAGENTGIDFALTKE